MGSKKSALHKKKGNSSPEQQRQKAQNLQEKGGQAWSRDIAPLSRPEGQLLTSDDVLQLQRTIGNRAVRQILDTEHDSASTKDSVQRQPKQTETRIIGEAAVAGGLTAGHSQQLIDKMDKKQSLKKARAIATQIEQETSNLVNALPQNQQALVQQAIQDYVSSSTAIQNNARTSPNAVNQSVQNLDAALAAIQGQINANNAPNSRITYRSITYNNVNEIPYGHNVNGNIINVGDAVGDRGFLSTSEHRQFVLGKTQTGAIGALLKVAIHSSSGVPIALHIPNVSYTNPNEQALWQQVENNKNKLQQAWSKAFGPGPGAGQAEVLFPRNAVFTVKQIQRGNTTVSVVLEEHGGPPPANVMNMKDGTPL